MSVSIQVCGFFPPQLPLSAGLCRKAEGRHEGGLCFAISETEAVFDGINGVLDGCADLIG